MILLGLILTLATDNPRVLMLECGFVSHRMLSHKMSFFLPDGFY